MDMLKGPNFTSDDCHSPLLNKAFDRYRSGLRNSDNGIPEAESLEELLRQAKSFEAASRDDSRSASLDGLEPVISCFNDFAAVMAVCLGADPKTAAIVWGSIRLAYPSKGVRNGILDMLEEISSLLPRFATYEETLPVDEAFESALVEAYTEMICFCAQAIKFLRKNPRREWVPSPFSDVFLMHIGSLIRNAWAQFRNDFPKTISSLKQHTQTVETEADAARTRAEKERHAEVLSLMKTFKDHKVKEDVLPCYHMPFHLSERFIGREDELRRLKNALDPQKGGRQNRSLALYGMGGVGKTAIARQYANTARNQFDAIFWISADNIIKMAQDFLDIAQKLKLVPEDRKSEDANAAMVKVKAWLHDTDCRWLIVFDNADDLEILTHAWPGSAPGSILLTSRDFTAAFSPALAGLAVQPFDDATGSAAFLELVGQTNPSQFHIDLAREITQKLGGLPLALRQISGFIVQQRFSLVDFLCVYDRHATTIHSKRTGPSDYHHTLSTVWKLSLRRLTGDASSLQKLLVFFDPDRIDETILTNKELSQGESSEFGFLQDEMDFLDAKEGLLRASLIDRSEESSYISMQRLVQAVVIENLTTEEREKYMNEAVMLLTAAFPCPWKSGPGYTFTSWDKCQMCLPHVHFLATQAKWHKIQAGDPALFAELLLRCSWYLYECERCHEALPFTQFALDLTQDQTSLLYAQGIDVLGLLLLDTNHPKIALECFNKCWRIREDCLSRNDDFVASALNHISLAYTELRDFQQAAAYQQMAMDIRLETNSRLIGNSYSNMSSILLGMGKPDEAEEMLMRCPSLKDMTDESFLRTDNPRLSSDMVLLSRIRVCQRRFDEALRLRSKALVFRQKTFGDKYKTCDSLYQIADLLYSRGDLATAMYNP
ncbi:hypothetical protein PRK78_003817 [Emydomyces testavorans]|uniref:NB-ARC domain-containing protein n=1 Tax=Emydomyces testavorans TaxID=2070801 RepID=A0AAF0IKY9_9EURO|nr:hypothetical protein PRK78_003817 [Emydomyces testavorans]